MSSNFSSIGFNLQQREDLNTLIEDIFDRTVSIETTQGEYLLFEDASGAELWLQIDKKKRIVGLNPHFKGSSKHRVSLTSCSEGNFSPLDGSFDAWSSPGPDELDSGLYPFSFFAPNYRVFDGINIPQQLDVQFAAFAQHIEFFESELAYRNSQEAEGAMFAAQSFIPTSRFRDNTGEDGEISIAECMFTGIVGEYKRLTNHFTNEPFYWLEVESFGGAFDVVASQSHFAESEPIVGGVISGTFWLSGKILGEPEMTKVEPSSLSRILKKFGIGG